MSGDLLKYHQWCISDPVAMSAYQQAIRKTVRPGDVVLDLGAGTGVLSYMACEAGARKVYAVEPTEIIALIPQFAMDNGLADRVIWKRTTSFQVELPEKPDVMIASMFGSAGIGNDMLDIVIDARERLLKPGGTIIPLSFTPVFGPVELPDWYETRIDCWNKSRNGFSFRAARTIAVNRIAVCRIDEPHVLSAPQSFTKIELPQITSGSVSAKLGFSIERSGTIHALAAWTEVTMAEGITCSSSPLDSDSMSWDPMVLPLQYPVPVNSGDRVEAVIRTVSIGSETILMWDVSVSDTAGTLRAQYQHSTFKGFLLTKEDLEMSSFGFIPALSERGKAELTVLELCDGVRPLDQIAANTLERFPRVLTDLRNARAFAAGVIRRSTNGAG